MIERIFIAVLLLFNSCGISAMNIVTIEQPEYIEMLTKPAQSVQFPLAESMKNLISAMKKKLYELGGVGLAAPQVNVSQRITVVYIPEEASLLRENVSPYPMHVLINPSYTPADTSDKEYDFEGCYSVSSKMGKVPRYHSIHLTYYDEQGIKHESLQKGFYARVLQHEIDHLNGLLITDRLTPDCIQGTPEEIFSMRRQELSEEKKKLLDDYIARKKQD